MILYNLKTEGPDFRITKFDDDLNPESSYLVNPSGCECPQGIKPTCRHRKMLAQLQKVVDTETFFCFDDSTYREADGTITSPVRAAPTYDLPPGVIVVDAENPEEVHNVIAEAVGEAPMQGSDRPWRRA